MTRASRGVLAGVVGSVVAAALVTAVVATARTPATLAPDSPEGVVQAYLEAVLDRDAEAATQRLAPALDCDAADLDEAYIGDDVHVSLRDVETSSSTALVDVVVTSGSGELIPSEWSEQHTFRLERSGDDWLISSTPWPLYGCGEEVPR